SAIRWRDGATCPTISFARSGVLSELFSNAKHRSNTKTLSMTLDHLSATTTLSRRGFIKTSSALASGLTLGAASTGLLGRAGTDAPGLTVDDLPKGSAPSPVSLPHFPDRLHAFVWRNWPLVPIERMASVVGARPKDIVRMGLAMGLSTHPRISRKQWIRSYLT